MMTAFIVILVIVILAGVYYYSRGPSVIEQLEQTQTSQPSDAKPEEVQIVPNVAEPKVARKPRKSAGPKLPKLPDADALSKMTKTAIAELALARGLVLDLKKTKSQMIAELLAYKPAKAQKQ